MCLGVPGKIIALKDLQQPTAMVDVSGVQREVNIACVLSPQQAPEDLLGNWVLIHVGFAMSLIDEQQAQETLQILEQMAIDVSKE